MIEVFFISLKGSSPGQPWMIPSVTSNSLCMKKIKCFKELASPVEPHLSIESNLIGAADEPELLATGVEGRPLACVRIFGARSVGFAELPFWHVFATVACLPDLFLQNRKFHHLND